ncbi:MAG: DUF1501 domain-containing protein [Verrucomicrobia bacterium]|nr:DUF1501 domain-containing protein [Verrucomicrobiota bacterium]MBI3868482.1 DUF1501 domain-containing protein [Verrucomicrobiota bacterium]
MLTIFGNSSRFCDGVSRRNFLRIGALGLGGIALPQLLHAESQSGTRLGHKAVIMVFLPGGPSHQDMFDLKTEAPSEVRGEFKPISTRVPGIQICEHLPRLAGLMDKFAIIRSMVGCSGDHDAFQCLTGRPLSNQPPGGWPCLGSVLSKTQGPVNSLVPPFVGLAPKMGEMRWARTGDPGFLGVGHAPFQPNKGAGKDDMILNGITLDRLSDRKRLLGSFDQFRRDVDSSGMMSGLDAFNEQAFGILTSSKLMEALDVEREDPGIRSMYGKGDARNRDDGGPKLMEHMLVARRLVEAGARCVTLAFSRWDHHGDNFGALRQDLPLLDRGLSALITDLHQRGLDKDVSVVVWGEFGRTPFINKDAGRDHWPRVSCALLAGGGMRTGQVIGSTDRLGGEASARPVQFGEVFATLYHNMGLDVNKVTLPDLSGRPQYLVDQGAQPMRELV